MNSLNEIRLHILTVKHLLLDAWHCKRYRMEWEEDKTDNYLFLAEVNLKQAELLLKNFQSRRYHHV